MKDLSWLIHAVRGGEAQCAVRFSPCRAWRVMAPGRLGVLERTNALASSWYVSTPRPRHRLRITFRVSLIGYNGTCLASSRFMPECYRLPGPTLVEVSRVRSHNPVLRVADRRPGRARRHIFRSWNPTVSQRRQISIRYRGRSAVLGRTSPAAMVQVANGLRVEKRDGDGDEVVAADDALGGQTFGCPDLDLGRDRPYRARNGRASDSRQDGNGGVTGEDADRTPTSRWA